jgi:hypothetical protein
MKNEKKIDFLILALNRWGGHSSRWGRGQRRGKGGPPENSHKHGPRNQSPSEESICLLSPRGTLEK